MLGFLIGERTLAGSIICRSQVGLNAAFTHANPLGSRFNGPERGAWHAGFKAETAKAEVTFHKSV